MKQYELPIKFFGPDRIQKYLFNETDLKNPLGQTLYEGLPKSGRGYVLHYTENTLKKQNAKEVKP